MIDTRTALLDKPAVAPGEAVTAITDYLTPVVITSHNWCLTASRTLARGLALEHKSVTEDSPEPYCKQCGYMLAGLDVVLCPGCGSQVR